MKKSLFAIAALTLAAASAVAASAFGVVAALPGLAPHLAALVNPSQFAAADPAWLAVGFGGLVVNRTNLQVLNRGFNALFKQGFESVKPMWNIIATESPSTTSTEDYGWLGKIPAMREWVGDRVYNKLKIHTYSITNKTYEATVEVEREEIEDDKFGVYNIPMQSLGEEAAIHPDRLVYGALQAGFSTLCYDNQFFFDTDHPVVAADGETVQSVSNFGGGGGTAWYLLNVGRRIKPIIYQKRRPYQFTSLTDLTDANVFNSKKFVYGVDGRSNVGYGLWQMAYASRQTLDQTNYEAARAAMFGFKFDGGQPVNQVGDIVLMVPPSLEGAALRVVQAEALANGATNVMKGTARVVMNPWLS